MSHGHLNREIEKVCAGSYRFPFSFAIGTWLSVFRVVLLYSSSERFFPKYLLGIALVHICIMLNMSSFSPEMVSALPAASRKTVRPFLEVAVPVESALKWV
jgi:hypothetical protein